MIDTHAHIDTDAFDEDRDLIINNALDAGLEKIIMPAIEPKGFDNLIKTAEKYNDVYFGIGVHPHNANEVNEGVLENIREIAKHPKCIAIGEIGLDYYYDFVDKETQKEAFAKQLELAKMLEKPVIVHNRESDDDILSIIKEHQDGNLRGVLHCFSSDNDVLKQALELGFLVSFTGNITFKKSKLSPVVDEAPIDRIMIETDSPYMTPHPYRGKRNEPRQVALVAEKISEIKKISIEKVIEMTTRNAKKLFNLSIFLLAFFISFGFIQAQDEEYYDEYEENAEINYENPYKKFIGIGPLFGTNTIVETYYPEEDDRSYEGILGIGGGIEYGLTDHFLIEFVYLYSKNQKISDDSDGTLEPNIHQAMELSLHWVPRYDNPINFFLTLGPSLLMNRYSTGIGRFNDESKFGINAGLGLYGNIKIKNAGLFQLVAEWKVNFVFGRSTLEIDPRDIENTEPVEISTFFSIPRFGVYWFPPFFDE